MKKRLSRGMVGEGSFRVVTFGSLIALGGFLILIVVSMVMFVNWRVFFSTFASQEVLFAIRLSFLTATAATAIAVLFAIPTSYAISKAEFWGKSAVDTLLDIPIVVSPVALGSALLGGLYTAEFNRTGKRAKLMKRTSRNRRLPPGR